ncbi:nuclear transport factor 2 family protein [Streptomyces sp. AS02]|uniref:nuclear transport factor 2 family protein n=1 Tax=Streptomyces sp. AS02 TaxID=2938946 RepID=UPI0020216755|nr:nuclear transport factor 2 family protein [Streptomyces sp. AS02]MCL8014682.1 nuclear transport factor 2 family protein [Streptomyces sp. AS02]
MSDDASAPPEAGDADRIAALAHDWAAAMVSNDPARIADFMADDWVIVSESGISTKARFLAYVESGDLTHSAFRLVGEPRVQVYGDSAVVTVRVTNTAHYKGERFDADEWTTDVFVRGDGGWRCVLSHITAAARPDV